MIKFHLIPLVLACGLSATFSPSTSQAQVVLGPLSPGFFPGTGVTPFIIPHPHGGFGAIDAVGARRRGWAEIVRARGEAAQDLAEAILTYERARSQYIDNVEKWTDVRLQRKRQLEAARREYYDRRREARDRYLAYKHSREPYRSLHQLTTSQFDPQTGDVEWPAVLLEGEFDTYRAKLDEALVVWAHAGTSAELEDEILATIRDMQAVLKSRIESFGSADYLEARQFLTALANEIRPVTS